MLRIEATAEFVEGELDRERMGRVEDRNDLGMARLVQDFLVPLGNGTGREVNGFRQSGRRQHAQEGPRLSVPEGRKRLLATPSGTFACSCFAAGNAGCGRSARTAKLPPQTTRCNR